MNEHQSLERVLYLQSDACRVVHTPTQVTHRMHTCPGLSMAQIVCNAFPLLNSLVSLAWVIFKMNCLKESDSLNILFKVSNMLCHYFAIVSLSPPTNT